MLQATIFQPDLVKLQVTWEIHSVRQQVCSTIMTAVDTTTATATLVGSAAATTKQLQHQIKLATACHLNSVPTMKAYEAM